MPIPQLHRRAPDDHKGTFGHVLIVGGRPGLAGSVALAGMAALRSGAGLVTVATPSSCQPGVAAYEPSYMTFPLPAAPDGGMGHHAIPILLEFAQRCSCVAVGPGMGTSESAQAVTQALYERLTCPMVVDADGLTNLSFDREAIPRHAGARILTPHPGEFRRLVGDDSLDVAAMRQRGPQWAADQDVCLVLKGHRSLVTDGVHTEKNETGNPGMATGGSGDVLTGIVVALPGQGMSPWDAARLAVHVHGLAGDLAADTLGMVSLIASDLVRFLPEAFRRVSAH